ncbi:putative lipoprotein with Yx(FWY)xxD motif [Micromonospora pisi]|uniref:Putative lipoprotein with Yx(FWY)xxD motif n=2 Tax=Micromonospora pisi TaxID=589240 RepID=A0A495JPV2_9ACTN|nr:putative lipoprotein with Yx(FWY)xxD motif [Micromonospora pisi]
MALMKRTVTVASTLAAMTAIAALTACAPAGYDGTQAADTEPVANAEVAAAASATPEASASPAKPPANVPLTTQLIAKKVAKMGSVVTDQKGWILYRFDKDSANPPTTNCNGDCARVWPPAVTDGNTELTGVDQEKVGEVTREDGTRQLTLGGWPLYRYVGDLKPGQWKGQGVGGTWFVVAPDGKKNLSCLPEGTPKAVPPPPVEGEDGAAENTGGDAYSY